MKSNRENLVTNGWSIVFAHLNLWWLAIYSNHSSVKCFENNIMRSLDYTNILDHFMNTKYHMQPVDRILFHFTLEQNRMPLTKLLTPYHRLADREYLPRELNTNIINNLQKPRLQAMRDYNCYLN